MKLSWASDPHFDHVSRDKVREVINRIADAKTSGVIISGDIGNSSSTLTYLDMLSYIQKPVYFVLGNHDFYGSSFQKVEKEIRELVSQKTNLIWLTKAPPIKLTDQTYLIGHDGWADGRGGMGQKSGLILNDYRHISDFKGLPVDEVFRLMKRRADEASKRLYQQIHQIGAKHIIVVTHAPVFRQASRYQGRISDDRSMPHFSNLGMGVELNKAAQETGAKLSIICGHTHNKADVTINQQVKVRVRGATYGKPKLSVINMETGLYL